MSKKRGRPSKYDPSFPDKLVEHFDIPPTYTDENGKVRANDLPTVEGFARKIGVNRETLYEWRNKYPEFSEAMKMAKSIQMAIWQTNTLNGRYNTAFSIFMGKNVFGWSDRQDTNITVTIEDKIRHLLSPEEPKAIEAEVVDDDQCC